MMLLSLNARADVTPARARLIACEAAKHERPPTFYDQCETHFQRPTFVTQEFYLFQGYDENHDCTIMVHVYRTDGRPVVHSECD